MVAANPSLRGMGTTVTALLRSGSRIGLAHIGDTRAYLVRDGEVFQITRDHTVVQSLLDEGKITEDEVSSHPQRFLLLQALDGEHDFEPDLQFHEAGAGDRYLLSSDGLHACVSADAIARVLVGVADPDQAAEDLIKLAMDGGGPDNVTCIVADIVPVGLRLGLDARSRLEDAGPARARVAAVRSPWPAGLATGSACAGRGLLRGGRRQAGTRNR